MSKLTKNFRTQARQTVTFTYDSGTSQTTDIPLDGRGSWTCNGCGRPGSGTASQAQQHAARCR